MRIGELFQRPIDRRVNPVVKVEDTDEHEMLAEIDEYVVTDQIARHFSRIIEQHYLDRSPSDVAIWISGFFGSGKSLFLKVLCEVLAHRSVAGQTVIDRLVAASDNDDFKRALRAVAGRKPAAVLSMHMKSDAYGKSTIVSMLWRSLHVFFGYSRTPWVAEMERSLEAAGLRAALETRVAFNEGRSWSDLRDDALLRSSVLAKALGEIDPARYPDFNAAEVAIADVKQNVESLQTAREFTKRCLDLLKEHPEYDRIFWGLDEMGQFAADRSDLLLELGTIVETFEAEGKGKLWLAATAQEKLDAVVANFADVKDLVAKIRDRFSKSLRVDLTSENAEEVVRERLLRKNSEKRAALKVILEPHEAWLLTEAVLHGLKHEYAKPELERTLDSYPFLPAHFQLITDFMQGLARDTGGTADKTARGPRALIEVTQDIARALADKQVGAIVRADHVYEHMQGSVPSEDADVLRDLGKHSAKPSAAEQVLAAAYVLDLVGVDLLPATKKNIERSMLDPVGVAVPSVVKIVSDSLTYLVEKAFVREVGSGNNVTFRFLKPYQRKIEEDVRLTAVQTHEILGKAREVIRTALTQVCKSKGTYKGVRAFSLGFAIDPPEFVPQSDILVNIYSPLQRLLAHDDARARSVNEKTPYWMMADIALFLEDVRTIVATRDVLNMRRSKATTEEERSQIRRAEDDATTREERVLNRAVESLRTGAIFVDGLLLQATAQTEDAIIGAVVERRFPALGRAPVPVDEKDLAAVFLSPRPTSGALSDLKLLINGQFSDEPELSKAAVSVIQNLTYKGGASGDKIVEELRREPYGYADMQTRLAIAVLCVQGRLKAFAPGGAVVPLGNGLEQRLKVTNDFKKTSFELEAPVDLAQMQTVIGVLKQRFDEKVSPDAPLVAAKVKTVMEMLRAKINQVELLVRDDVPQAKERLSPLKSTVNGILQATSIAGAIAAVAASQSQLDIWQPTIKPLEDQLNADGVEVIRRARALSADDAVVKLMGPKMKQLQDLIAGPHPWQDMSQIRALNLAVAVEVKSELTKLHVELAAKIGSLEQRVAARGAEVNAPQAQVQIARTEVNALGCAGYLETSDGRCSRCSLGLTGVRDRIDSLETKSAPILAAIRTVDASNGAVKATVIVSLREKLHLPKDLSSKEDIEVLLGTLRFELERLIEEHGRGTIVG